MHTALYRSAALSLALAAMLLRAFLPDGWMPSAPGSGTLFTICSVAQHESKAPRGEGHTHVPCAFAAASTLAPPALAALAFGVSSASWLVAAPVHREEPRAVRPHRPHIARAPPAFA
ncbi:MAG TPA: hypothetical protein VKT24_06075 [Rhizomicrobium sp.]|nr:hypothetical protein [Rhizomicrobium sp.]